ncbi:trypsin-like peptidase domain-containing protein [Methylobacterium oxalidis]|uniref:trypsin-like peptidase domain-containing protein n=1 Tax=Methylobacterium oxalidis TaxID=944322 RepID=UPI0033158559
MTAIVDAFPYPFDKPMAQELVRVMAGLYRTEREAFAATQPFGIDPLDVTPNLAPLNLWWELLRKLAIMGTVRQAVAAARDQFPNNPRASFLSALLADTTAPLDAAPVDTKGPGFDDRVSQPEALLFFDDLTMPAGKVPNLIETLRRMTANAPAVCLLRVQNEIGSFFGTGFRIGKSLVLTNHHVLFPRGKVAADVHADFGFDVDVQGAALPVTSLPGTAETIEGEKKDDWAVVEVNGMPDDWPVLDLVNAPVPKPGDLAYILQHPNAQQKRLGFVRNMISEVDDGVVRYLTDTEPGSSGAPVFDEQGRLIALHHAGGRPVEVAGKPPVAKNEGIRISRVLERLKATGVLR